MRLMSKEDVKQFGRVILSGKSFDFVVRFVSKAFYCFKYTYVACLKVSCRLSLPCPIVCLFL